MDKIDKLREKLHVAIDQGNTVEILRISEELDIEIVEFMRCNEQSCEFINGSVGSIL